jgi:hypothetical protein
LNLYGIYEIIAANGSNHASMEDGPFSS